MASRRSFFEHDALGRDVEGFGHGDVIRIDLLHVFRIAEVSVAAVAFVEAVFPLHHHAEVLVVQDERLGGDLLDVGGGEFLHVHEE